MIVEPIKNSGSGIALSAQTNPETTRANPETARRDKETEKPVQKPSTERLQELASEVQDNLRIMHNIDLQFSVHKASGQIMVVVRDESTGKVIREIPSREVLNLAAKFDELAGMLIDKKG